MTTVHDVISHSSIIAVVVVVLFVLIMSTTFNPWTLPLFLLLGSVVIYFFANIKPTHDTVVTPTEASKMSLWSIAGLGGLALIGVVSQGLFVGTIPLSFLNLTIPISFLAVTVSSPLFAGAMAVSETTFFQGALFSYFKRYGPYLAIAATIALGLIFHLRVYGTSPADLMYAGLGYGMLSFLVHKTKRLGVAIIVHVANNVMSFIIGPFMVLIMAGVIFAVYTSKNKVSWRQLF